MRPSQILILSLSKDEDFRRALCELNHGPRDEPGVTSVWGKKGRRVHPPFTHPHPPCPQQGARP